jgi:uncharacterized membrane protein HdeD (DUF308 family)
MFPNDSIASRAGTADVPERATLQRWWLGLLFLGLVQVVGGVIALAVPLAASLAAAMVFGAVLVVAGVFQAVHSFGVRKWSGVLLHAVGALLYIAAGIFMLLFPLMGALTLALVVTALLFADGVLRTVIAYRLRPEGGWGWLLAAGIAGIVVGSLLLIGWPLTGVWAIGILLGVNLVFAGAANCALAAGFHPHKFDFMGSGLGPGAPTRHS